MAVTVGCGSCIDLHGANASLGQWNCFFYDIGPWWAAVRSPVLEPFGDVATRRRAWAQCHLLTFLGQGHSCVHIAGLSDSR
jgi:hypothetical protein